MAYSPFHVFRKHQKAVFAALTIVCMLTFVMSSGLGGAGDAFVEIQRLLTGRGKYPEVGTLYGRTVDLREISILREQRRLANTYMAQAVNFASTKVFMDVQK